MHRILSRFQHSISYLIRNFLSNPRKQITTICPTKDDSFDQSFPLSQNSWSLGSIPIFEVCFRVECFQFCFRMSFSGSKMIFPARSCANITSNMTSLWQTGFFTCKNFTHVKGVVFLLLIN